MKNKKRIWIGSAFLIVLFFLLLFRLPVIEIKGSDNTYYLKHNAFTLGWIHSIEKEEWFESYQREKQEIVLVETYFKTFGAGTPYEVEKTTTKNGFIRMEMDMTYDELNVTVSKYVDLSIYVDKRKIPLHHYFNNHENIRIKARSVFIWEYMGGRL